MIEEFEAELDTLVKANTADYVYRFSSALAAGAIHPMDLRQLTPHHEARS